MKQLHCNDHEDDNMEALYCKEVTLQDGPSKRSSKCGEHHCILLSPTCAADGVCFTFECVGSIIMVWTQNQNSGFISYMISYNGRAWSFLAVRFNH